MVIECYLLFMDYRYMFHTKSLIPPACYRFIVYKWTTLICIYFVFHKIVFMGSSALIVRKNSYNKD